MTSLALLSLDGEFSERFAEAASLQLSWVNNSTNENGFKIERRLASGGTYAIVATVGPNITGYVDSSLQNGTGYCYRVHAFNSAGALPYSPETCGMTVLSTGSNPLTLPTDDVNGDRMADLILRGTYNTFWVSESTGSRFTTPTLWLQHDGEYVSGQAQYADLNGDAKTDVIYQGSDNVFWVSLSTGTGFTAPAAWVKHGETFAPGQAQYADVNSDGKADLIFQGADNSFWVSLSISNSFTAPQLWLAF